MVSNWNKETLLMSYGKLYILFCGQNPNVNWFNLSFFAFDFVSYSFFILTIFCVSFGIVFVGLYYFNQCSKTRWYFIIFPNVFIDNLFAKLAKLNIGCYVGRFFYGCITCKWRADSSAIAQRVAYHTRLLFSFHWWTWCFIQFK